MKPNRIISLILLFSFLSIASYRVSYSYFSDSNASRSNVFSVAAVFPTPTPITNHVVISEVQINGTNASEDFVELYNPTNSTVDLSGWQIQKKNSSGTISSLVLIPGGKSIPAHGYFLWANDEGDPSFGLWIGADVTNGNNLSENNSIALEDGDNVIVDQVGWGTGTNQYFENIPVNNGSDINKSMERKAYSTSTTATMETGADALKGNSYDSNDNSVDFILRSVSQPQNSTSGTETP